MVENLGSATPIVELTDEEIDKLSKYAYSELKQTVTRLILSLSRYQIHYDLLIDSMARVLGELISLQVDAEKVRRDQIEVMVIELIMDQGRAMTNVLKDQKNRPTIQQTIKNAINESQKEKTLDGESLNHKEDL